MRDPDRVPVDRGGPALFGAIGPPAESRVPGIGEGACGPRAEAAPDPEGGGGDPDIGAQPVHGEPPHQPFCERILHVHQQAILARHDEEIGEILALRRQERGMDETVAQLAEVVADQPLQEVHPVGAGEFDKGAVGGGLACHWYRSDGSCARPRASQGGAAS